MHASASARILRTLAFPSLGPFWAPSFFYAAILLMASTLVHAQSARTASIGLIVFGAITNYGALAIPVFGGNAEARSSTL